jgi:hypothetical protein
VANELVSACRYATSGRKDVETGCPPDVSAFAAQVLATISWHPAEVFVLEVCETESEFRVAELNPFETSGLSGGDQEFIVRSVSRVASEAGARNQASLFAHA